MAAKCLLSDQQNTILCIRPRIHHVQNHRRGHLWGIKIEDGNLSVIRRIGKEVSGLYEKLQGSLKTGTWSCLAPDLDVTTENGVTYNLQEMEDLIRAKEELLKERKNELIKLVPDYKETPLYIKKKKPLRLRRPRFQAVRPKPKKTEKEKEAGKEDKGKPKAKVKEKGKVGGGESKGPPGGGSKSRQ